MICRVNTQSIKDSWEGGVSTFLHASDACHSYTVHTAGDAH